MIKDLLYNKITDKIIKAGFEVYNQLGTGFVESVYEEAFVHELNLQNIAFEQQKAIDVYYKEKKVKQFFCDLVVEDKVIVELKAIKNITELEMAQVINYLKAANLEVGLLLNFGSKSLEFKRLVRTNLRNP